MTKTAFVYMCADCDYQLHSPFDMIPRGWERVDVGDTSGCVCASCARLRRSADNNGTTVDALTLSSPSDPAPVKPAPHKSVLSPVQKAMIAVQCADARLNHLNAATKPDSDQIARATEQYQFAHHELSALVKQATGCEPLILIRALRS